MRRSKQSALRRERIYTALTAVLAGLGALTLSAMLLSAIAAFCDMSSGAISAMSGTALAAGCFSCSFFTANRRRKNGMLSGFLCGAAVFCAVLIIGCFTVKVFSAGGIIIKLLIILSASALGGIKGVNSRPVFGD